MVQNFKSFIIPNGFDQYVLRGGFHKIEWWMARVNIKLEDKQLLIYEKVTPQILKVYAIRV